MMLLLPFVYPRSNETFAPIATALKGNVMSLFKKWAVLSSFVLLFMLSACASAPKELELLDATMNRYEKAMLWGEYGYALGLHKNGSLSQLEQELLQSIKVTAYEVLRTSVNKDRTKAFQLVEIRYYNRAYAIVRSIKVEQEWAYERDRMQWVLLTPFPTFK